MEIISPIRSNTLNFSNELQIELSVIESGLIVTKVGNSVVFIIKDSEQMMEKLNDFDCLLLNFTKIPRPEFPAINAELKLKTIGELFLKYNYFFNPESEYELSLLHSILNQININLYFLTDNSELCIRTKMERTEIEQLRNCL